MQKESVIGNPASGWRPARSGERILTIDTPAADRVQTSEKKNLLVDSFVKWRIIDPRMFRVSFPAGERSAEPGRVRGALGHVRHGTPLAI